MTRLLTALSLFGVVAAAHAASAHDVFDRVHDHFADHDGVRIHWVELGRSRGPLVVMIHGFPDFWYTWRAQMPALAHRYRVVAIDQRGYNLSDKPVGVEQYDFSLLVGDVAAVIRDAGRERAVVVGHDWGGEVAWFFAMQHPEMTEALAVLDAPHPRGLLRALRDDQAQRDASAYARAFQQVGIEGTSSAAGFAAWVTDPVARARYVEALGRSDLTAMLNYYRRNYPREPYADVPLPPVQAPTLLMHGLADVFLLPMTIDGTWPWVADTLTSVTVPGVGHFIQQDAADTVTTTLQRWLDGLPLRR